MKFLLTGVNAKYIHSNPALYSLRAYSVYRDEHLSSEIEIAEYTINQQISAVLADIYERKPDVIAFSCYIWNWEMIQEAAEEVHKIFPDMPIWLGGPEVSFNAEEILEKMPFLTGIMVGEGEETFYELLTSYVNDEWKEKVQSIRGIVYRDWTGVIRTNEERGLTDLSSLPFFYDDMADFRNRIIYYESSRGCPYRCSYCLSSIDKKVRLRDLNLVYRELDFFLKNQVPQVKFVDRTFNCNHAHAQAIWQYIRDNDNGVTNFHFEISADILNEEELALLETMRPGLVQLEIGVQSTNPETIREIRRVMDAEKLAGIVKRIRSGQNVHVHLDLIAGLPYEDFASFRNSFNDVYAMEPEQLQLGFLKVLKGSHMKEMEKEYGIACLSRPPYEVLYTKWLSFEDVLRLKKVEEMVELYYNSNQYTHVLPVLVRAFETPFDMFLAMAEYYEEKGYFYQSPARSYRYQILLDFAVKADADREELYRELLVFDLYLRENMKSRPSFAGEQKEHYEKIMDFYRKEEEEPRLLAAYADCSAKQMSRMTHIEYFRYPVNTPAEELLEIFDEAQSAGGENASREASGCFLLFDYKKRSPLTQEAAVYDAEKE